MLDVKACSARSGRRSGRAARVAAALLLAATVSTLSCTELKSPIEGGLANKGGGTGGDGASGTGGDDMPGPDGFSGTGGDGTDAPMDASMDTGSIDAGPTDKPSEDCAEEGRLRCSSSNARQRESCESGKWTTLKPCSAEEVCDFEAESGCTSTEGICIGNEDKTTCVGTVLYTCGSDGTSTSEETCSSAEHCAAGLAGGKCVECVEDEFHCDGTSLESCVDGKFEGTQTCTTAALCNEVVGDCTTAVCLPDQYVCTDDKLTHCNDDQTALVDVDTCAADLCDEAHGQCDKCFASQVGCQDDQVATCTTDGQQLGLVPCGAAKPKCIGQGLCVECVGDGNCAPEFCVDNECVACRDATDCGTAECESRACTNGACVTTFTNGATCQSTNVCTSSGTCVECRNNNDCVARGDGTKVCLGAGTVDSNCVQCSSPANCPAPADCRTATCSAQGNCGTTIVTSGSCGSTAGRVCNLTGVCETACGNNRYDVGVEECDATSSSFDTYTCSPTCKARSLYTPCGSGKPGCVAPATCQVTPQGSYCSPDCSNGGNCNLGAPAGLTTVCFGTLCLIECDPGPFVCPTILTCPGPGQYCDVP